MDEDRATIQKPDDADYLAAIWIIASNDDNPIITFEGLKNRLRIDIPRLRRLVESRPELFRPKVSEKRLAAWKAAMLAGKGAPGWINDIENSQKRKERIEALTQDDVFRSQFRSGEGAPRSDVKLIEWGLKHLDRLRTNLVQHKASSAKSWQVWLTFAVAVATFVLHVCTAVWSTKP